MTLSGILPIVIRVGPALAAGALIVLLGAYLWLACRDVWCVLRNYHLRQAERCHWTSCGFYFHEEDDPTTAECLQPFGRAIFDRRRRRGTQHGCRYSVQVREHDAPRKPAADYLDEWLKVRSGFSTEASLWKIVALVAAIVAVSYGWVKLEDVLKLVLP